jgi:GABA(A) receptor-associated protein
MNEKIKESALHIKKKYEDSLPVYIENCPKSKNDYVPKLDKNKYIVPKEITMGQLNFIIRKRIKLGPEKALFITTKSGDICNTGMTINEIYEKYAIDDGFLYLYISGENTFG